MPFQQCWPTILYSTFTKSSVALAIVSQFILFLIKFHLRDCFFGYSLFSTLNRITHTHKLDGIHQETVRKCDVYFRAFSLLCLLCACNAAMSKVTLFFFLLLYNIFALLFRLFCQSSLCLRYGLYTPLLWGNP